MTGRDDRARDGRGSEGRDELDRLLVAAFADQPVPEPSPRFDARLARRLDAERKRLARRRLVGLALLAVYWSAVLFAIGALVGGSGLGPPVADLVDLVGLPHLPAAVWTPVTAVLVLTLAGAALPFAALADRWSRTPGLPRRVGPAVGP